MGRDKTLKILRAEIEQYKKAIANLEQPSESNAEPSKSTRNSKSMTQKARKRVAGRAGRAAG